MEIKPLGNNWFSLYSNGSSLEYNAGPNPTAQLQEDRRPLAQVFRHIDGDKVVACIIGGPSEKFFYKDSGYEKALELAKQYITDFFNDMNIQSDIFSFETL